MNDTIRLIHGDCLEVLKTLPSGSVDAVVTDPPAGIGFMGKEWDSFGSKRIPSGETERDAYRASDPNRPGYAFQGGSGLTQRDRGRFIAFLSSVMSETLRVLKPGAFGLVWALPRTSHWTATALEDARFEIRDIVYHIFGQGFPKGKSCLKPAVENWILVRKPGKMQPLQIDECRIALNGEKPIVTTNGTYLGRISDDSWDNAKKKGTEFVGNSQGRWPANLALSHHPECNGECHPDCPVRLLDEQSGISSDRPAKDILAGEGSGSGERIASNTYGAGRSSLARIGYQTSGGASRFFYCSKASRRDRGDGNNHPTVKSTKLMRWLVSLITPSGGLVLDPFMGSGTTGVACVQTGRRFIGIEIQKGYFDIASKRIAETQAQFRKEEKDSLAPNS